MFETDTMFLKIHLKHGQKNHNPQLQNIISIKNCKNTLYLKHIENTQNTVNTKTNCTYHFRIPFYPAHSTTSMAHTETKWPVTFQSQEPLAHLSIWPSQYKSLLLSIKLYYPGFLMTFRFALFHLKLIL